MKHILNNLTEEEKNSIREQHTGGKKIMIENFNKLINSTLGDSKPLMEQKDNEPKNKMAWDKLVSKLTIQQNAAAVTPPTGFTNYLGITSSSAYSVTSTDFFYVQQSVEGFNIADLGWGTASAQTVTLSFWVRSSLTGTFSGTLRNYAGNRSYPFTYTISAANTWEYETVTIAGDTSGTWSTNNSGGVDVGFSVGAGSSRSGTAGAWAGAAYYAATGAVSVVGTNGATFYITGVQLEKGSDLARKLFHIHTFAIFRHMKKLLEIFTGDKGEMSSKRFVGIIGAFVLFGTMATAHSATAGQLMPCVTMSAQAVVAIRPPTVRFADHRFRSPLVLNASVRSNEPSSLVNCASSGFIWACPSPPPLPPSAPRPATCRPSCFPSGRLSFLAA